MSRGRQKRGSGVKKPELLAPAGGWEQLRYAINFGADAVYCATDRFGLRQRADNFSLEDIVAASTFAHESEVDIFVTCNAYMNAEDLKSLPAYLETFEEAKVDALIISDMGAFRLARKYAPQVALHVSTQASCSNAEAALAWYELGARRVVCAREMSLSDIRVMREALPDDMEMEVFVHGAMCMAISGRCLISDYMTGRSANRGHCTQPCRWEYTLEEASRPGELFFAEEDERGTYLMNSKDLCMLEHVDDLIATGVDSLKIEGRNKKAFYVATVVNAYRQVLDGAPPARFLAELNTISHRPYSTGFFYGFAEQDVDKGDSGQIYDWVAEVLEAPVEGRVKVACRNRFYEGDTLEILSPHTFYSGGDVAEADVAGCGEGEDAPSLVVRDLRLEFAGGGYESTKTANRAMDTYSFYTDHQLRPSDILRVKRKDPLVKN